MLKDGRLGLAMLAAFIALAIAAAPVAAATATVHRYGDRTQKIVALTFDDGYSASRSQRIADILSAYGVTGTFFPYADAVRAAPSVWRGIAKKFPIANHTISHPNLKRLTASQVYREIDGARRIIEQITNRRMIRIFRPPYGAYNTTVLTQSYAAGFRKVAMWSVDSGDALGLSDERVYERAIAGGKGSIVLLHAGPPSTVRVLARIIRNYRSRGFRFVNLADMLDVTWNQALISTAGTTAVGDTAAGVGGLAVIDPAPLYRPPYRRPNSSFYPR